MNRTIIGDPRLTALEAETLLHAAANVNDDLSTEGGKFLGWSRAQTAAYWRARQKMRQAMYTRRINP